MMLVMVGFGLQVSARTDRRADRGQLSFIFRLGEQIELNQPLKDIALLLSEREATVSQKSHQELQLPIRRSGLLYCFCTNPHPRSAVTSLPTVIDMRAGFVKARSMGSPLIACPTNFETYLPSNPVQGDLWSKAKCGKRAFERGRRAATSCTTSS